MSTQQVSVSSVQQVPSSSRSQPARPIWCDLVAASALRGYWIPSTMAQMPGGVRRRNNGAARCRCETLACCCISLQSWHVSRLVASILGVRAVGGLHHVSAFCLYYLHSYTIIIGSESEYLGNSSACNMYSATILCYRLILQLVVL